MNKDIIISPDLTIKEALQKIEKSGLKCIFIEKDNKLIGSLSDGDVRRLIIQGKNLNQQINNVYNKNPKFLSKTNYSLKMARKLFSKYKLDVLPITEKNKVVDIIAVKDLFKNKKFLKKNSVFILAGGKGERLMPFTSILPKPLIPINGTPIIKLIINNFNYELTKNIFISLNYKYSIIKSYISSEIKNYKLKFIKEKNPLGTIGSLKLVDEKDLSNNIIVTFCDIIFQNNMDPVLELHEKSKNDLTFVVASKKMKIPYGVCKISKNGKFIKIDEKPETNNLINVGYYIISKKMLKYIPKNKKFDMTELIQKIKSNKNKIGMYTIDDDSWFDVGEWPNYKNTLNHFNNI
ncbi:sugar phosphate nucleotidyltransferase [Candidatus Pelagibacter sp.]|nr:sugar phosphate nucleotidyltransferase [Candidatus Pelagibacter sp.]